jgi:hypothetical protein
MQARLPSASSTTQYDGAAQSLTRRPPAAKHSDRPHAAGFAVRPDKSLRITYWDGTQPPHPGYAMRWAPSFPRLDYI